MSQNYGTSQWELSKENIQPLKEGRNVCILSEALKNFKSEFLCREGEFKHQLSSYTGDDPLSLWYSHILWIEQNCPKGGKDGNLIEVVENCLINISQNEKCKELYRNDKRFLDLWIKYACASGNPADIYNSMKANEICTNLALFYETLAWEYEKLGTYHRADAIFLEGIKCQAQPLEQLKSSHAKFQLRAAEYSIKDAPLNESPKRTAFSLLKINKDTKGAFYDRSEHALLEFPGVANPNAVIEHVTPAFKIFQDNEDKDYSSKNIKVPKGNMEFSSKENQRYAEKWANSKVKQAVNKNISVDKIEENTGTQPFTVHCDDNFAQPSVPVPSSSHNVLAPRLAKDDWHVPLYVMEQFNPYAVPQYNKAKVYQGNEEFSLEELMAEVYLKKLEKSNTQESHTLLLQRVAELEDKLRIQESFISHLKEKCKGSEVLYNDSWVTLEKSVNKSVHLDKSVNKISHMNDIISELKINCTLDVGNEKVAVNPGLDNDEINIPQHLTKPGAPLSPTVNTKMALDFMNRVWSESWMETYKESNENVNFKVYEDENNDKQNVKGETGNISTSNKGNFICNRNANVVPTTKRSFGRVLQPNILDKLSTEEKEKEIDLNERSVMSGNLASLPCSGINSDVTFKVPDNTEFFNYNAAIASTPSLSNSAPSVLNYKKISDSKHNESRLAISEVSDKAKDNKSIITHSSLKSSEINERNCNLTTITETSRFSSNSGGTANSISTSQFDCVAKSSFRLSRINVVDVFDPHLAAKNLGFDDFLSISNQNTDLYSIHKEVCSTDIKENEYIDPFDGDVLKKFLVSLEYPLENRSGFISILGSIPHIKSSMKLQLSGDQYFIRQHCSSGAYATVFHADSLSLHDRCNEKKRAILKIQKPPCMWEFYICDELQKRLEGKRKRNVKEAVLKIDIGYFFDDGSVLVSGYNGSTTFLEAVNMFKKKGESVPEEIVIYYMIEIILIIESIHQCDIVHGDIKPDNLIIVGRPVINSSAATVEEMFAQSPCSVKLLDFGRSIDMSLFPKGTTFTKEVITDGFTCCEMREGKPWSWQIDYYGIAATAHCALWGSYMNVVKDDMGFWKYSGVSLKRYWMEDAWNYFFKELLNAEPCLNSTVLRNVREKLMNSFFYGGKSKNFLLKVSTLAV